MLALTLTVVVIAQNPELDRCAPGLCGGPAMVSAFQQAVRRVLGNETRIRTQLVTEDPPDEAATKTDEGDGLVELSFSPEGQKARLHCYVARENRWVDREISFGESHASSRSEINERGRLLGFAVATMYASEVGDAAVRDPEPASAPAVEKPAPQSPAGKPRTLPAQPVESESEPVPAPAARRVAEFGGVFSTGLGGTASGLGASAGFRLALSGPVWARLFVTGRSGNIPEAQASTRTVLAGGGVAFSFLPGSSPFELGTRLDLFASYFDVSHLSEDDPQPDRRSRWQAGGDWVAEGGWRFARSAGVFLGAGLEGILGKTEVYTHHQRVATVPPFRAIAELGFRTRF